MFHDIGVFEGQWTSSMWPYVVTLLKCTPRLSGYMTRFAIKNGHYKDMCY
jgi:hypothetical protein